MGVPNIRVIWKFSRYLISGWDWVGVLINEEQKIEKMCIYSKCKKKTNINKHKQNKNFKNQQYVSHCNVL